MTLSYATRLHEAVRRTGTPALVGIDPRFDWLPDDVREAASRRHRNNDLLQRAGAFEEFSRRLIDVVAPLVPAVKPQAAFFEELGPAGCLALSRVIQHARSRGLIVICDAKRGDIGTTAEAYARAYLAGADPAAAAWGADALTVNPYLGRDSLEPFVKVARERGAGIYVLVRTSNPGARDFQDPKAMLDDVAQPLYRHVAASVERFSAESADVDGFGCVGAVVGATYPKELAELREAMPHTPLLVPGYGAQGGGAAEVAAAFRPDGLGALVNSSRGINFAIRQSPWKERFAPHEWEQAVLEATRQMIADLRTCTPGLVSHS